MKELPQLTIKLTVGASEALETLEKVKVELEQIVALRGKIAEPKVQISAQHILLDIHFDESISIECLQQSINESLRQKLSQQFGL